MKTKKIFLKLNITDFFKEYEIENIVFFNIEMKRKISKNFY